MRPAEPALGVCVVVIAMSFRLKAYVMTGLDLPLD
jgi:hypothetical protein